jgi:hypothetical protein
MAKLVARLLLVAVFAQIAAAPAFAQQVQDGTTKKTERKNPEMYWTGVGVSAIGGFMIGWGLGEKETVTCGGTFYVVSCEQTGAHKGMYIGVGAALVGAGAALSILGGKRVTVAPTRGGGVVVQSRVKF